jgi:hypothetical protein
MDLLWWLLGILVVGVWVVTLLDISRHWGDRPTGKSVAWLVAILVFPVVGTIAYFIVNDVRGPRREPV